MAPVPVVRGLFAQPRATVQVMEERAGTTPGFRSCDREPIGLPPATIMPASPHTGTQGEAMRRVPGPPIGGSRTPATSAISK